MYTEEQIDAIGLMLEEKGLSHAQIDEYFEHFGVVGMKWGIRKGKAKTGVNRFVGAKMDINKRRIYRTQNRMNGTGYKASEALGRVFLGGKERQLRLQKAKIKDLTRDNVVLKKGVLSANKTLGVYGNITFRALGMPIPMRGPRLTGLVLQRTPKPLVKPPRKKK